MHPPGYLDARESKYANSLAQFAIKGTRYFVLCAFLPAGSIKKRFYAASLFYVGLFNNFVNSNKQVPIIKKYIRK
jgi:hypothetical protein